MNTYLRDTRLRPRIVAGYCDRNCHYTMLHAREFDFSEKDRAPSLPPLRLTLARERVQTRLRGARALCRYTFSNSLLIMIGTAEKDLPREEVTKA